MQVCSEKEKDNKSINEELNLDESCNKSDNDKSNKSDEDQNCVLSCFLSI